MKAILFLAAIIKVGTSSSRETCVVKFLAFCLGLERQVSRFVQSALHRVLFGNNWRLAPARGSEMCLHIWGLPRPIIGACLGACCSCPISLLKLELAPAASDVQSLAGASPCSFNPSLLARSCLRREIGRAHV